MRLRTYAGASFALAIAVIYHAFSTRRQFYPALLYLSTSKISLVLLLNMGLVMMCILWKLVKLLFLGSLREAEVERLNEQSWREVMEILFAITIFREEFSVSFLAMVTTLLLIKALHWLAQKRVEYIETTPTVPRVSHLRIVSFLGFLIMVDGLLLYSSVSHLIRTREASVALFFSFEYMILATSTISTFIKYVFYVSDMIMDGQWEKKAVYTFYLELIRDLLHLSLYLCFFLVIFVNYGLPLHLIRELYDTFRNFKIRIADYIRYRKLTSNMNERFPDATEAELSSSDATCIICREEMITAKKLRCGHLFHVHCLRSWLQRQQTCPICRSLVVPADNASTTAHPRAFQSEPHQRGDSGTSFAGKSIASSSDSGNEHLTRSQTRLQAAAAAAAVYGKSFVHPSLSTYTWSAGAEVMSEMSELVVAGKDTGGNETIVPNQEASSSTLGTNKIRSNMTGSISQSIVQLEMQEKFLKHQIEVLQKQRRMLAEQQLKPNHEAGAPSMSSAASSSSNKVSTSESGPPS